MFRVMVRVKDRLMLDMVFRVMVQLPLLKQWRGAIGNLSFFLL